MDSPTPKDPPGAGKPSGKPSSTGPVGGAANPPKNPKRAMTPQEIAARLAGGAAQSAAAKLPPAKLPPGKSVPASKVLPAVQPLPPAKPTSPARQTAVASQAAPPVRACAGPQHDAELVGDASGIAAPEPPSMAWRITIGVAALYALLLFVPWQPTFPPGDLDGSWVMVLHWAFAHHVDFGHDLIFTYGPLGFIWGGYNSATYFWEITGWMLFTAAFVAGAAEIARHLSRRWWIAGIVLFFAIALAGVSPNPLDVRLFALSWMLILIHFYVDDRPLTVAKSLLTAAIGAASLVKFSISMMAFAAIVIISIDLVRRKRALWLGAIYLGTVGILWLAAGQPIGGFAPWVYHSWFVASHFASAESGKPDSEVRDVTLFLQCAGLFLIVVVIVHLRKGSLREMFGFGSLLAIAGLLAALFLMFKNGYVRHDAHEAMATTSLALLSILFVAATWRWVDHLVGRAAMVLLIVASLGLAEFSDIRWSNVHLPQYLMGTIVSLPGRAAAAGACLSGSSTADADYQALARSIREQTPLPAVSGTVDVYPWAERLALANGFDFDPRPVIQSYTAYTPGLEEENARFLRGPKAPESILLELNTIDHRYPAQDDALSWPELLTRYDLADCSKRLFLLRRSAQAREFSIVPLKQVQANFDDWVDVPESDSPLWASFDIKTTALGAVRDFLYKPPVLTMQIKTRRGQVLNYRLVTDIAQGGFLLSPAILDRMDFAMLRSGQWKQLLDPGVVTQVKVSVFKDTGEPYMSSRYSIGFSELRFPPADISQVPGVARYTGLVNVANSMRYQFSQTPPQFGSTKEGEYTISAPANSILVFPIPAQSSTVHLGFAMMNDSYMGSVKTDGVTFACSALSGSDLHSMSAAKLFSRRLDPANSAADQGPQSSPAIPLPAGATHLMLQTTGGPEGRLGKSAWLEIEFK